MTKAWHADELAALQALLQEQGDTGVDWDGLARQLPRIEGFPVRTGRAVKSCSHGLGDKLLERIWRLSTPPAISSASTRH